jgi:hypothetical protein
MFTYIKVDFVDGDNINDPDLDRSAKVPPCATVLASIAELKVSMYTNIALCCHKLIAAADRINAGAAASSASTKNVMNDNTIKELRGIYCRQLVDFTARATKIIDMLALRGTHARPIVKELLKKHEEAKFFGQVIINHIIIDNINNFFFSCCDCCCCCLFWFFPSLIHNAKNKFSCILYFVRKLKKSNNRCVARLSIFPLAHMQMQNPHATI